MAQDTDPGIGTGSPATGGLPSSGSPSVVPSPCVSFDRSLEILIMGNKAGAYGLKQPNMCEHLMFAYQREGWIDKMRAASSEIKRDLGAPMCPEEIYNELHPLKSSIRLRQAPVAYLGKKTGSIWTEVSLTDDPNGGKYIEICDSALGGATIDEVQVSYPDSILECYSGMQSLQTPCVTELVGTCGGGENGYKLWWPDYQLIVPTVDETTIEATEDFLTDIKYRVVSLDASAAYELVGTCECECCSSSTPLTLTLQDATEGLVCINGCENSGLCYCSNRQIRINYATAFSYGADMDPALEEAIVLLALVRAKDTPAKPCGCDNSMIDSLLETDPTAATEFATKLSYGPTVAGMSVMRIMNKFKERPHFNQPVFSGGLLSGRRTKKTNRRPSVLRGY